MIFTTLILTHKTGFIENNVFTTLGFYSLLYLTFNKSITLLSSVVIGSKSGLNN